MGVSGGERYLPMSNMKTQKVKINGLQHQFYFWGSPKKPKLFLFHGWLDTAASFDFLCPYLEKKFYCIAPDIRGFGKSEHTPNPLGYFFFEYIADLHEILRKFSPKEPASVLGHSMGGAFASFYAGAFPERIRHFINVEGFAFRHNPPERGPQKARRWIEELHTKKFQTFSTLEKFSKRLQKSNPRLSQERAIFLAKHLTEKVHSGFRMAADPKHKLSDPYALPKACSYAFWNKIKAKCLLIYADETEMNQWVKSDNLQKQMGEWFDQFPKNSPVVEIKNCGHMIHHEKPEELAKVVLNFLTSSS